MFWWFQLDSQIYLINDFHLQNCITAFEMKVKLKVWQELVVTLNIFNKIKLVKQIFVDDTVMNISETTAISY